MSSDALLPLVYIDELQRTREASSIKRWKGKHSWSDCSLEKTFCVLEEVYKEAIVMMSTCTIYPHDNNLSDTMSSESFHT
jgi:hypothetical protein